MSDSHDSHLGWVKIVAVTTKRRLRAQIKLHPDKTLRVMLSRLWVSCKAAHVRPYCSERRAWNYLIFNIYLTAIGLSPGGSGFKHMYKYLTLCYWHLHLHRGGYMRSMYWHLRYLGTTSAFAFNTEGNQERKPVSRWSVAELSGHWHLASGPASKVNTAICTFQQNTTQGKQYTTQST